VKSPGPCNAASLVRQLDEARERSRQLEAALVPEPWVFAGMRLCRQEAIILTALMRHGRCSHDRLLDLLGLSFEDCTTPTRKTLQVVVCKLRAKLVPDNIRIETWCRVGYGLTTENLGRLRALEPRCRVARAA
jgi:DNA-binding response OmpR family regulator